MRQQEHLAQKPLIEPAYNHLGEVRALIEEYIDWLRKKQPDLDECLAHQSYDAELDHLGEKYGPPRGRLYVARIENFAVGCIALRPMPEILDEDACEMKRLYVKPHYRGAHIGGELIRRILDDARSLGYDAIYLDTLPILDSAVRMYRGMGFQKIPRYNDNPIPDALYMKMDLRSTRVGS